MSNDEFYGLNMKKGEERSIDKISDRKRQKWRGEKRGEQTKIEVKWSGVQGK